MGILTADEKQRWDAIKYAYVESVRMSGMDSEDQAGQLMRQLASMRDGLESIRQVIAKAVAASGDGSEERMDARVDLLRQSLSATAAQLAESLQHTTKELQKITQQQALEPPRQEILVQHKVPRLLAELLKGQFHLMQEWLRPILSESRANGRDLEQLSGQLQALLQKYQEVEQSLAETQPKDAASG
jgi:hypothetical protein